MLMLKVLVVDDEIAICEGMRALIEWERYGYCIPDIADNGFSALAMLEKRAYNLVITDIRMPGVDGLELAKLIRENNHECNIIIMSGYKEFKYAQTAIEYDVSKYLLKPLDEIALIDAIVSIREKIQERFLKQSKEIQIISMVKKSLLQTLSYNCSEEANRLISGKEIFVNNCNYLVFLIKNIRKGKHAFMKNLSWLRSSDQLIVFEYNINTIGLLYITPDNEYLELVKEVEQLSDKFGENPVIIVGCPVYGSKNLFEAFDQASKVLEISFFHPDSKILYCQDFNESSFLTIAHLNWNQEDLCHNIMQGNTKRAMEEVDRLINILFASKISVKLCMSVVSSLVLRIFSIVSNAGGYISEVFGLDSDISSYYSIADIKALEEKLKSICKNAINYLIKNKNINALNYLEKVKEYIEKNYTAPITVKSLATLFFMNPAYLGRKFQENIGMKIKDYLTFYRIEQSKKLLLDENIKVSTIYSQVGFSDNGNYYLQFSKISGMTPSQYRRLFRNKQHNWHC